VTWTSSPPTTPGWYWWRTTDPPATVVPALVFMRDDGILRVMFWGSNEEYLVANIVYEWSSTSIEPPTEYKDYGVYAKENERDLSENYE